MKPLSLLPLALALPLWGQVTLTQGPDSIKIDINGEPFTEFFIGAETAKPYLHPLRSVSGKIVTRRYPMEIVEGERQDHPHHRGLWFAHGDVNGTDFWSADPSKEGSKFGKVVLKEVRDLRGGDDSGSLTVLFDWLDADGSPLVSENRTTTFHVHPTLRIMDFDIKLTGVRKAHFGDTKEGTFAIRVAAPLNERHTGKLVNATGTAGEKSVWGKQSPWMDYSGEIEGEKLGVAIFDHPGNPKHPTYWHVRGYGLFAANVFGEHDFYRDEARDGGMTLAPGRTWRFRYRVVIHPGDAASAGLAGLYEEYARMK